MKYFDLKIYSNSVIYEVDARRKTGPRVRVAAPRVRVAAKEKNIFFSYQKSENTTQEAREE